MKKEVGQLIAQRDNYLNLANQEVDQTVKDRYLKAARQLEEAIDLSSGEDAVFTPTPETISEYTPYIPKEYEKTVINGRPGKDGKDAVVDYDKIVSTVTKKIKERPEKVVKIEKSLSEEEIEEIKESIKKDISYNDLKDIPLYRPAARDYDFLELKDVPKSYTGKAGKVLKVKTDERGVEFADAASGTGDISGTGVANELACFTAEKTIDNLPVATYPSLTELSYVKGVTSAIQTQLNGKQASGSYEVTTNKETSALDTSTTKYPCNNVVKEAVDAKAPSASPTFTGTVETPAIKITTGASLGKVLTSDADGNGSWGTIPGGGDMLLGTVQSVTAEKIFDKDKLSMKGTSTGKTVISTANTSATDYTITMPAATGTVALTSNIVSQVEDNITDGHTTIAPSGNAVFDALALKADTTAIPVKASGAEIDTGTDDAKFTTPKAIADSKLSYTDGTETLTNKRITPRVISAASYTTDTGTSLSVATCDQFEITAQAGDLKFNNPGGTPLGGQKLIIRIKDNGTARALTYDTQFRAMGNALPSTTVVNKTLYLGLIFNATDTKWDLVALAQEA